MAQENVAEENVKFVVDGYARFNAGESVPGLWFLRIPECRIPSRTRGPRLRDPSWNRRS